MEPIYSFKKGEGWTLESPRIIKVKERELLPGDKIISWINRYDHKDTPGTLYIISKVTNERAYDQHDNIFHDFGPLINPHIKWFEVERRV